MKVDVSLRIKACSLLLSLVNVFLVTLYYDTTSVTECIFVATSITSLVISVVYQICDQYLKTYTVRKFDAAIHSIMAIIMICVSSTFLIVMEENDRLCYSDVCWENHVIRILCGVFGVIVGVLYGTIGILLTSEKQISGYEEI